MSRSRVLFLAGIPLALGLPIAITIIASAPDAPQRATPSAAQTASARPEPAVAQEIFRLLPTREKSAGSSVPTSRPTDLSARRALVEKLSANLDAEAQKALESLYHEMVGSGDTYELRGSILKAFAGLSDRAAAERLLRSCVTLESSDSVGNTLTAYGGNLLYAVLKNDSERWTVLRQDLLTTPQKQLRFSLLCASMTAAMIDGKREEFGADASAAFLTSDDPDFRSAVCLQLPLFSDTGAVMSVASGALTGALVSDGDRRVACQAVVGLGNFMLKNPESRSQVVPLLLSAACRPDVDEELFVRITSSIAAQDPRALETLLISATIPSPKALEHLNKKIADQRRN